jgi:hypothetical protein
MKLDKPPRVIVAFTTCTDKRSTSQSQSGGDLELFADWRGKDEGNEKHMDTHPILRQN